MIKQTLLVNALINRLQNVIYNSYIAIINLSIKLVLWNNKRFHKYYSKELYSIENDRVVFTDLVKRTLKNLDNRDSKLEADWIAQEASTNSTLNMLYNSRDGAYHE